MDIPQEIYARTQVLVPHSTRKLNALVCGAGMVGSWTVAALARMVNHVTVIDYDKVELVNVGVQLYTPMDEGSPKVDAVMRYMGGLNVVGVNGDVKAEKDGTIWFNDFVHDAAPEVVVSAIDSMEGRKWLAERSLEARVPLFVDVRVMGEMVCVLAATYDEDGGQTYHPYFETIVPDDEVEEATCGSEGTVYSGLFAASRVAAVVNNWATGCLVRPKEVWNVGMMEHLDKEVNEYDPNDEDQDLDCPACGVRQR